MSFDNVFLEKSKLETSISKIFSNIDTIQSSIKSSKFNKMHGKNLQDFVNYSRIFILRIPKDAMPNKERELNWIQVRFAPINRPLFSPSNYQCTVSTSVAILLMQSVSHTSHPHIRVPTLSIT